MRNRSLFYFFILLLFPTTFQVTQFDPKNCLDFADILRVMRKSWEVEFLVLTHAHIFTCCVRPSFLCRPLDSVTDYSAEVIPIHYHAIFAFLLPFPTCLFS